MSEELSIETLRIRQWIENNIGGRFVRFEKLSRWRPSWEADVELDGSIIRLHVRGDRGGSLSNRPLRREYDVLRLLEQNGIPVPRLYGWCDDPEAIIMANLPDTPFMGDVDGDPTVQGLVESYAEHLAAIHRLDAQAFIDIGISAPGQGKALALNYLHFAEERYLADKDGPDALITFACQWLRRNAPGHRNMITPLVGV